MKISKVDHTRMAVGKVKERNIQGFMYQDPTRDGNQNIDKRLEKLEKNAKILYNIFMPVQEGTEPKDPNKKPFQDELQKRAAIERYNIKKKNFDRRLKISKMTGAANKALKGIIFQEIQDGCRRYSDVRDVDDIFTELKTKYYMIKQDDIVDLVALALRKSLRKYSAGVSAMLRNIGNKGIIPDKDRNDISDFIKGVSSDFNKISNCKEQYERSVENQNLTFQVVDGEFSAPIPAVSGKKKDHKYNEKVAMNRFLEEYAVLDTDVRMDKLRRLRRIVDLYFSAPDGYNKDQSAEITGEVLPEAFDVWERHEQGKKREGWFVEIPEKLLDAKVLDSIEGKKLKDEINAAIEKKNIGCYRFSVKVVENDTDGMFFDDKDLNVFWIHHIENSVERILENRLIETCSFKLRLSYLVEKVWKDIINYLSIKYIALGKTVFNFGMNDLYRKDSDINTLGNVDDAIKGGITSFDLEMIKARETLQREVAVAVMFATNNLARATVDTSDDENSDFLLIPKERTEKRKGLKDILKNPGNDEEGSCPLLLRDILQFFGGKSKWVSGETNPIKDAYNGAEDYAVCFLNDLKNGIYSLRNDSFHFVTAKNDIKWKMDLIGAMFEKEAKRCLTAEKDKMYSNNLPMFYTESSIRKVLGYLYEKDAPRASQIPAFNKLVVRKNFPGFLYEQLKINRPSFDNVDTTAKWMSALYYLLKEVYYNRFIQSDKAKQYFISSIEKIKEETENLPENGKKEKEKKDNAKRAVADFEKRINGVRNRSLSEICQLIMTEYNYQNNQRKVRNGKESPLDQVIFKHYPLLLNRCLAIAFSDFVKEEECLKFISDPKYNDSMPDKEKFLADWSTAKYDNFVKKVKGEPKLQSWYITCRFLNGRMLNQLAGSIRSYIQYIESIERRAGETGNTLFKKEKELKEQMTDAVKVVEICIVLSSFESVDFYDYFTSVEDYVSYLQQFVECDLMKGEIYLNEGGVTIINRNVLQAKLFAPDRILRECVPKITEQNIDDYIDKKDKISEYRVKLQCETDEEQKNVVEFQRLKNRIELRSLVEYGEIINELLGQLVNWSFIRERDLMYFQLGYHYMCLKNESKKPDEYKSITVSGGNNKIDNAILYQIAAMYIYGLGLYAPAEEKPQGNLKSNSGQVSNKIAAMCRYSQHIGMGKDDLYNSGIELFEVKSEHDDIINVRNYIDHFRYYNTGDAKNPENQSSIRDLYSEVFDRFFTYDMKYQKSVVDMLDNILLSHMVDAEFSIGTGMKNAGGSKKERANINIARLAATNFTYKFGKDDEKKTLSIAARDEEFMQTLLRILYYPALEPKIRITADEAKVTDENGNRADKKQSGRPTAKGDGKRGGKRDRKYDDNKPDMSFGDKEEVTSGFGDLLAKLGYKN